MQRPDSVTCSFVPRVPLLTRSSLHSRARTCLLRIAQCSLRSLPRQAEPGGERLGKPGPALGACMRLNYLEKQVPSVPPEPLERHQPSLDWHKQVQNSLKSTEMCSLDFSQQDLTSRLLAMQDAGAALGLQHTCVAQPPSHPEHPAATSTMRLKLAPTGRALEHDRMIRASLERRHHLQCNDLSLSKCATMVVEYDGEK